MPRIVIKGGKELLQMFKRAPRITRQELVGAVKSSAAKAIRESRRESPVDNGKLRDSILPEIDRGGLAITVFPRVKYALPVHEGRGEVRPKRAKVLAFRAGGRNTSKWRGRISKSGYVIIGKRSKATRPNRFMDRGFRKSEDFINRRFRLAVQNIVDKM